jgi:hypothetical protein
MRSKEMKFTPEMLEQLAASVTELPIYLDKHPPRIEDPAKDLEADHWQPVCITTNKLTKCLEAIRDISAALSPIMASTEPEPDKRLVKPLVTPIYNLAVELRDLYNDVESHCWEDLTLRQQRQIRDAFQLFTKSVPTDKGTLKTVRDKIASHLDKDLFTTEYRPLWQSFTVSDIIFWIRKCMDFFGVMLLPDIYSWTRSSGHADVAILMNVDGNEVSLLLKDDQPECIVGFKHSASPKYDIAAKLEELASKCTAISKKLGIREGTTWKIPDRAKEKRPIVPEIVETETEIIVKDQLLLRSPRLR